MEWVPLDSCLEHPHGVQCGEQKKAHFQPSVEVGMKSVDKDIDKRNKQ